MIEKPMDVLTDFPVRKTKRQKQAFRDAVQAYAASIGYESRVETGSFGCQNLILGNPEQADYLVTAHYDTCARLPIPNFLTPCNFWLFLLWQLALMLLILGVCIFGGLAVGLLTGSGSAGVLVGYLLV